MAFTTTKPRTDPTTAIDQRPRFGIGHMSFPATNVDELVNFYTTIGMRLVVNMGRAAILELRGGTHLILQESAEANGTLDVIVDDIDETRAVMEAAGANAGSIRRGSPHDSFVATDPQGNTLMVHSNHAMGPV